VLLSGGVDSLSVAFGAHRLGKKITGYSFHLNQDKSYDYCKAEEVCKIMGWRFVGVPIIKTTLGRLEKDWMKLVKLGCVRKTHYECVYPFLHLYPAVEETFVLSGWAADGYYGMSRKANTIFHHDRKLQIQFMDDYFSPKKQAGYIWHKRVADEYGKILITPYLTEPVKEWFYKREWDDLNRENGHPKQKRHIRKSFTEFERIGKVKNHINLQKGSGVDVLFETLLRSKKINIKKRKNTKNSKNGVMWMCKDWEGVSTSYHSNSNTLEDFM
jgi:asparagine synthetase B (glutamine-hydrolysing)